MEKLKRRTSFGERAITLIALVVTIVILLILAGVTIAMTLGQNGLFTRAREGAAAYNESEVRDDLSMLIIQYTWDKAAEKADKSLGDYLKDNGATSVKENSDGKTLEVEYKNYVFTVDKDSGEIKEVGKAGSRPQVSGVKVTEDSAGQGNNVGQGSIESDSGKKLYITFTSSIEGGTTTVSPAVPYEVSKNGRYKFTIIGTVGGKTYSLEYTVTVNQYKVDTSALIGKVVSYIPDASANYDLSSEKSGYDSDQTIDNTYDPTIWKIMEVDESGNITKLFGVLNSNHGRIYFKGSIGYNNGVYLLNDICKSRYGNVSLGATARSMNIEDIESRMNSKGLEQKNSGLTKYGETVKCPDHKRYPAIYAREKYSGVGISDIADGTKVITDVTDMAAQARMNPNGKSQSDSIYDSLPSVSETQGPAVSSITCANTYYNVTQNSSYYDDNNFYNMLFEKGTIFWLASRFVSCGGRTPVSAEFGLRNVSYTSYRDIAGSVLFDSLTEDSSASRGIAPVVTFDSAIQIKSGSGTTDDPYVIGK